MKKNLRLLAVAGLLAGLFACNSTTESPVEKPAEKPIAEKAKVPEVENRDEKKKEPSIDLPQAVVNMLPETTLALGVIPSLAEVEKSLKLGALITSKFSSERRGLRPLDALNTIGAGLDDPESWQKMGLSPRTALVTSLVDQNTLIIALETTGKTHALPRLKMVLTALTGTAPEAKELPNQTIKLTIDNSKVWALMGEKWLMIVLTSGTEEPTPAALSLGEIPKVSLAKKTHFTNAYPAPSANQLLNTYVNLGELIRQEISELRMEKHGSWLYAEKLLEAAIRDDKPNRVINHWRQKVEAERQWSKEHKPGLLAAADALEKSTAGIEAAGGMVSLAPYGLEAEIHFLLQPGSAYGQLFPDPHPTDRVNIGTGEQAMWLAGSINSVPFMESDTIIPFLPGSLSISDMSKKLGTSLHNFSIAMAFPSDEGSQETVTAQWAFQINNKEEEIQASNLKYLERLFRSDKKTTFKSINAKGIRLSSGEKTSSRTIPQEGQARWLGMLVAERMAPLLKHETKTVSPKTADPMEAAIIEEMNDIRRNRDLLLHEQTVQFLKALGTLDFRVLPLDKGWQVRLDLNAPDGMKGVINAWSAYSTANNEIMDEATRNIAEKRTEIRKNKRTRRQDPALP